jgi:nitroreductase
MELYDAMQNLRAVRRLKPDPIPDDVLARVLQAAAWAPSGGNQQPWRVVVVTDPDIKQSLADLYKPEWVKYVGNYQQRLEGMPEQERAALQRNLAAGDYLADHLQAAPVLLLFCFDPRRMAITDMKLDRISVIGGGSIYLAVENLMLACVAEGLGCVLTTLHCHREPEIRELLGIPDPWGTAGLIPLGYPIGRGHGPVNRRPPSELAFRDRFGATWG